MKGETSWSPIHPSLAKIDPAIASFLQNTAQETVKEYLAR
jgi:hypothetical protein